MRPRVRTRVAAALLASMTAGAAVVGVGEVAGAAFGAPQSTAAGTSPSTTRSASPPTTAPSAGITATARLFGADRYATAAAVSAATFPNGAHIAYLATGRDYPDALTAAAAAGGRGPVLLAGAGGLPPSTLTELQRLRPAQVVIVGGTAGLSATTEAAVHSAVPAAAVLRIAGADRYATAAAVATATFKPPVGAAWVATGEAFPDALSAAAAAAGRGPVLLVPHHGIPLATTFVLGSLQPRQVFLVGGTGAIAAQTQATLAHLLPHSTVTRLAGADRYGTAAAVSAAAFPSGAPMSFLATGQAFPDALTAAGAAGGRGPVLLVGTTSAPPVVVTELQRLHAGRLVLVGGASAVGDAIIQQINAALARPTPTTAPPTSAPPTTTGAPTPTTSAPGGPTTTLAGPPTTVPGSPPPPPAPGAGVAVATAEAQIGKPYQWAGAGPDSFDCSGLTMFAWAAAGVALPHNASDQQAMLPAVVPDPAHLAPGDLLFYDNPVDHVAIYVGAGMMVEAAHTGIPVRLVPMRTDQLMGAGRP
jgi:cell wall-associated NlpC family hydrolase